MLLVPAPATGVRGQSRCWQRNGAPPFGDQSLRWRDIASARAATTEARGRRYGCWCPGLPSKPNSTAVRGQRAEQLARGRISPRRPAAAPASTPDGRPDTGRSVFGVAAMWTGASVSQAESMVVAAGGTGRPPTAAGRNGPHPAASPGQLPSAAFRQLGDDQRESGTWTDGAVVTATTSDCVGLRKTSQRPGHTVRTVGLTGSSPSSTEPGGLTMSGDDVL